MAIDLDELLAFVKELFPKRCFLTGLSLTESGKTISLSKARTDTAIGLDLRNWSIPGGGPICDGLFCCFPSDGDSFRLVFVELKGRDKGHSMTQLQNTVKATCKNTTFHRGNVPDSLSRSYPNGHDQRVFGVILAKRSLPKKYRKKKLAKMQDGLIVKPFTARKMVLTMQEIVNW